MCRLFGIFLMLFSGGTLCPVTRLSAASLLARILFLFRLPTSAVAHRCDSSLYALL